MAETEIKLINGRSICDTTARTKIDGKVDKVNGKGLSTVDFTEEKDNKLSSIEDGANNYTHPENHNADIIIQDSSHRFVTDEEKQRWDIRKEPKQIKLETNGDYIQWGYVDEDKNKNLVSLNELRGDKVLLRASDTHIQYAYESELINKSFNIDFNSFGETNGVEKEVTLLDTIKTLSFYNLPEQVKSFKINTISILAKNESDQLQGSINPSSSSPVDSFPELGGLDPKREEIEILNNQSININSNIRTICEYALLEIQEYIPEAKYISKIIINASFKGQEYDNTVEIRFNVAKEEDTNIVDGNDELWTNLVEFDSLVPSYSQLVDRVTKLEEKVNSVTLEWMEKFHL